MRTIIRFLKISIFLVFIGFLFFASIKPYKKVMNDLKISNIIINGNEKIQASQIDEVVKQYNSKNLFFLNPWKVRENLKKINFIDDIQIKKIYPNNLSINILEKKPVILLKKNNEYFIVDMNLRIDHIEQSALEENNFFKELLYIEAKEIDSESLNEYIEIFKAFLNNEIKNRINGIYFVGGRRWDMMVDRRIKVMLPEKISKDFIEKAFSLIDSLKIKGDISESSFYTVLDLRIKDRVFIKNIDDK